MTLRLARLLGGLEDDTNKNANCEHMKLKIPNAIIVQVKCNILYQAHLYYVGINIKNIIFCSTCSSNKK